MLNKENELNNNNYTVYISVFLYYSYFFILSNIKMNYFFSMKIKSHDIEDYSLAFDENTKIPYFYITEEVIYIDINAS